METQNIEYKESWRDEYLKWICGFANAQGGTLYIGMNDKGEVVGVDNAKRLLEDIPNKVSNILGIVVEVNILDDNGKSYLSLEVPPCSVPISFRGQYYRRSGATLQELKGIALQDFIMKKVGLSWDDAINERATMDDIDEKAVSYMVSLAVDAKRMPATALKDTTETVLKNLKLLSEDGKLKNAAIVLFGKCPTKFVPGCFFKIGRFGTEESDLWFQDVVDGNIIQMADKVLDSLRSRYLISPVHYEGLLRKEPLEIPENALREAIFNAIIHKNYMGTAIQLKVYNDRVQLWNYGGLPENHTTDWLLSPHTSIPRNENIANAFYLAGFIEAWGRGIEKIVTGMMKAEMDAPEFRADSLGVFVTFHRKKEIVAMWNGNDGNAGVTEKVVEKVTEKVVEKVTENQQAIMREIREKPFVTASELSEMLGISLRKTQENMRKLRETGLILRVGPDKGGHWEVVESEQ